MHQAAESLSELDLSFFERGPEEVARALLGCHLVSSRGGHLTGGVIVETEAYLGHADPGSHAATKGITSRNQVMYGPPGTVYVYFTYGVHHMFNLVCCPVGEAGAVLVRAIEPRLGVETMTLRRGGVPVTSLCDGPAKLTQSLAIDLDDNATTLGTHGLRVYHGERVDAAEIVSSGRVGLSAGHELELRYYLQSSLYVSKGRTGQRVTARQRSEGASR